MAILGTFSAAVDVVNRHAEPFPAASDAHLRARAVRSGRRRTRNARCRQGNDHTCDGMSGRLEGSVALVTGAAQRTSAPQSPSGSARRVPRSSSTTAPTPLPSTAASIAERIAAAGGRAIAIRGDVAAEDEVAAMVAADRPRRSGRSGSSSTMPPPPSPISAPWHELTAEQWNHVARVNLTGSFICARAVYPAMRAAGDRGDREHVVGPRAARVARATSTTPRRRRP